jgi:hypothetical protein
MQPCGVGARLSGAELRCERGDVVVSCGEGTARAGRLRRRRVQPRLQLAGALSQRVRQRVARAKQRRRVRLAEKGACPRVALIMTLTASLTG